MKKIDEKQCQAILDELLKLNVPIQSYAGIQKLFQGLEVIKDASSAVTPSV